MGRRQFYAWVEQVARETGQHTADDPHTWAGTSDDEWWQQARQRRKEIQGR